MMYTLLVRFGKIWLLGFFLIALASNKFMKQISLFYPKVVFSWGKVMCVA